MAENEQSEIPPSRDALALTEACQREGCPLCLVTLERMDRVLDLWLYEASSEMENRQVLIRSRGFCSRHTWQLAQLPNVPAPFALTMVYRSILPDLLEDVERDLRRLKAEDVPRREPFWHRFWPRRGRRTRPEYEPPFVQQCPFCLRQGEIEHTLLDEFLSLLAVEEFQTRLQSATGLCLTHFTRAVQETRSERQRAALLTSQRASLQRILAELEELVRKHDYRFLHEPRGPEMTAWRRAAQLLAGHKGLR